MPEEQHWSLSSGLHIQTHICTTHPHMNTVTLMQAEAWHDISMDGELMSHPTESIAMEIRDYLLAIKPGHEHDPGL